MPLDICGAESQGMIGYMLQQSLDNELRLLGIDRKIATIVSQTMVDAGDPAFSSPTKPIGPFYTAMEASKLKDERGWTLASDAGKRIPPRGAFSRSGGDHRGQGYQDTV